MWTQPKTDDQRRYYSKHAAEKRVFGWITTLLQTAHGAIAFAAWTAIYLWVFKNIPVMLPTAPFLAGGTLVALHILFRTTWQTYWYDRLDDDPNTDSPIWVPAAIIVLLLGAEVQGARQYLAAQVSPVSEKTTEATAAEHASTVASIEQAYRNDVAAIAEVYKAKLAPLDRRIYSLRSHSTDTDDERRTNRRNLAAAQAQRDQVLTEKAAALATALATATDARSKAVARRDQAVAVIDTHNAGELARYTADMGSVSTYAWVLSVGLLLLISGLSYRAVRINVKSGILPLRNYTVLDAHGSIAERLFTAFGDALNRRGLQFAVWIHRLLSPKQAITSFDGNVVAKPGTYNTPEGFFPPNFQPQQPVHLKTEEQAAQEVLEKMAANPGVRLSPDKIRQEVATAMTTNGHYKNIPLSGKPEAPAGPAAQPAGAAARQQPAPTPTYAQMLDYWRRMVLAQLAAYDEALVFKNTEKAAIIQDFVFTDPMSPIVKEGNRLRLVWGMQGPEMVVRHRDRDHFVKLQDLTESALLSPISTNSDAPAPGEDENLFKYDLNKFKQEIQVERDPVSGKVIGVKYKKTDGTWGNIGFSQVKAYWNIYRKYTEKDNASARVKDGFGKWSYALSLFEEGREVLEGDLQTVSA